MKEFINWNVQAQLPKNGQVLQLFWMFSTTNKSNLCTYERYCIIHQKPQPNFFCFFWQKTIVVGKAHTVCQANNPTSIHSHTHFERATEKRSRPNLLKTRAAVSLLVHFIPISKNQSGNHIFPASTSYIFDIFEKTCHIVIVKVIRCRPSKLLIGLPKLFPSLTKFPSRERGWNIVLTGIFSWQMIVEGLSSYPP